MVLADSSEEILSFDGEKGSFIIDYKCKNPIVVTAIQQQEDFSVNVAWQENPLTASAGDWLISDGNEQWPVAADIFANTYRQVGVDKYVKEAPLLALQMDQPFKVKTPEGEAFASAGDYLVQGPAGESWPIPKEIFEKNYEPSN
jgi:hypothetical protein